MKLSEILLRRVIVFQGRVEKHTKVFLNLIQDTFYFALVSHRGLI